MDRAAPPPPAPAPGSDRWITAVGLLLVAAGFALAAIRFFGGSEAEDGVEGALGAVALGAPIAATGVLALLGRDGPPALLLPAAMALVPFSFLSFALVTLPLLVPAWFLIRTYFRRARAADGDDRSMLVVPIVAILLVAAVAVLFAWQDERSWTTSTGGGSVSDVITYREALLSLALTSGALLTAWIHRARSTSRPPVRRRGDV